MEVQFFKNQSALRSWFEKNHNNLREAWIGYYKRSTGKESINWDESVEEAICFGWIDGIRKSIDGETYKIRFTPRNPGSNWSLKNIKTAEIMIRKGRMTSAGLESFKKRQDRRSGVYSYEQEEVSFSESFEQTFRSRQKAWTFFTSQPAYYRRVTIRWVMSAKQEETRLRRLKILITDSENQVRIKPMR